MLRITLYITLFLLLGSTGFGQGIRIDRKLNPDKSKTIRLDKPVVVKTFNGTKVKGLISDMEDDNLVLGGKKIELDKIMMISGVVIRNSREKAAGVGLTIGAVVVLVPALYYVLGGIAWGMPNGIFIGATVMVFDLLLAYVGTNLMGIFPRRFSTMNWQIVLSPMDDDLLIPPPLPLPSD